MGSGIGQITAEDLAELDGKVKATQDAKRAQNAELARKKEEMEAALAAKKGDGTSQQRNSVMEQMDHAIMDKAIAQQQAEEKQLQADKERRKEASHDKMQAKLAARKAKQNKKKADEEVEVVVKSKASGPARGGDTTAQVEQSHATDLDTREAEFQAFQQAGRERKKREYEDKKARKRGLLAAATRESNSSQRTPDPELVALMDRIGALHGLLRAATKRDSTGYCRYCV